jgi:hypothetical protein
MKVSMNMNKSLLAVAAIALAACSTQAQVFNTISGPFTGGAVSGQFGHIFTVGAVPLNVTSLAFVSSSGGALNDGTSVSVAIYQYNGALGSGSLGNLVTSVNIGSGSAVLNNYAWESAAGLLASGNYAIVAEGLTLGGSDAIGDNSLGDGTPNFAAGTPFTQYTGWDLIIPGVQDTTRWKAVNFAFTPVPEPETYAMVAGLGLVAFGLWRRRQ